MSDTTLRDQLAQVIYDTLNGQYGDFNMPDDAAEAILDAGWRPPARVVTTDDEARTLPVGTVICDADAFVAKRLGDDDGQDWGILGVGLCFTEYVFSYPLTVLWEPDEGDAHGPERCPTCGCDLAYPTAVHVVDCGEGAE